MDNLRLMVANVQTFPFGQRVIAYFVMTLFALLFIASFAFCIVSAYLLCERIFIEGWWPEGTSTEYDIR